MWSGSPRSSWCALCAVEVCVRTSMAWSSVSLLCVVRVDSKIPEANPCSGTSQRELCDLQLTL